LQGRQGVQGLGNQGVQGPVGTSSVTVNSATTNQLAYYSASSTISGSSGLTYSASLLNVTGGITASSDIQSTAGDIIAYSSSDRRLKTNIEPITDALNKVNSLDGITYNWNELAENKDTEIREAGLIAQQVAEVLPEVSTIRENGYMAIRYERVIPLLVEAIKELSAEVKELKKKLS
jgi:hypothetical protein